MTEPTETPITVREHGHILLIGLNRPDKYNAMNLAAIEQLAQAYQHLEDAPHLRVGVVHAHGDHFSAGLDLAEVGPEVATHGPGALVGTTNIDPYGLWAQKVSNELALASDIVVAAENVRFRQLEIARGIMPFGGATIRATQQLGWGNAMKFLLTGEEFGAEEALRIGLIQEITPVGKDTERAIELAEVIAKQAPLGVYATLANARVSREDGEKAAIEHLSATLPGILASKDAAEGIASFLERRDGNFSGA